MENKNFEVAAQSAEAIQISTLETIVANGNEILFIKANRSSLVNSENVKGKIQSLKSYGVLTPFQMIPAKIASDDGLELLDEKGMLVTDADRISKGYCILDGNNRYKARLEIRRKAEQDKKSGKVPEVGKGLDDVSVLIYTERPAKGVLSTLMEINTTNVKWKFGDYASTALKLNPDNEILQFIVELKEKYKFSPASISLYLTFNDSYIKESHIANAIKNGEAEPAYFAKVKLDRAKRILSTLEGVGFEMKVIKTRYLIKFIIENAEEFDTVLKAFSQLSKEEVDYISSNVGKDPNVFDPITNRMKQAAA